jgi:hypothetical protein
MLTKTTVVLAAALMLCAGSIAMADNEKEQEGGYRELGPGGAATQGINPAFHPAAAAACAKLKDYDPSTMTYVGSDGVRRPCP